MENKALELLPKPDQTREPRGQDLVKGQRKHGETEKAPSPEQGRKPFVIQIERAGIPEDWAARQAEARSLLVRLIVRRELASRTARSLRIPA